MLGDVHEITVWTPSGTTYDDEGLPSTAYDDETVCGRMTGGSLRESTLFAQRGITLDAVALVPIDTAVDETCEVTCASPPYVTLGYRYRVVEVRPNLSHNRLVLTRTRASGDG